MNCSVAACAGLSCGANGRVCTANACACPGGQSAETSCGDARDNDCDGAVDCADPDCNTRHCGGESTQRCCARACVDTTRSAAHCQGCGLACASGQSCTRIRDGAGTRGHCTCIGTGNCPKNPAQICRDGNNDGQDLLCACDVVATGNAGCATGQVCQSATGANFCRY